MNTEEKLTGYMRFYRTYDHLHGGSYFKASPLFRKQSDLITYEKSNKLRFNPAVDAELVTLDFNALNYVVIANVGLNAISNIRYSFENERAAQEKEVILKHLDKRECQLFKITKIPDYKAYLIEKACAGIDELFQ